MDGGRGEDWREVRGEMEGGRGEKWMESGEGIGWRVGRGLDGGWSENWRDEGVRARAIGGRRRARGALPMVARDLVGAPRP